MNTATSIPPQTAFKKSNPYKYRILKADKRFLNAGTGLDSWFTLEQARQIVDYTKGQQIVESDGVNILWEAF